MHFRTKIYLQNSTKISSFFLPISLFFFFQICSEIFINQTSIDIRLFIPYPKLEKPNPQLGQKWKSNLNNFEIDIDTIIQL